LRSTRRSGRPSTSPKAAGTARFAWNWGLAEWQRQYAAGEKPSQLKLRRQLNAIKREQFPWMLDVTKHAPQHALINLGFAFSRFFAKQGQHPRFKKKGVHDSFRAADSGSCETSSRRLRLPRVGWIRMREEVRFNGRLVSVTVSRVADRWFASIAVEVEHVVPARENQAVCGVDLGVRSLATFSDGTVIEGPKALRANLSQMRRLSRGLSRKVKGSANRRKAKRRIARLHARIANIRGDALHKLTTELVRRFSVIGIEDLNVRGMAKRRSLSRAISDMGFHEFRRQLEYKAALSGSQVVVADRFFPSSKTCSDCGAVLAELALSERAWTCPSCGVEHDRDLNAARNLAVLAAGSAVTACGEDGAGRVS
jgi:putative transposase